MENEMEVGSETESQEIVTQSQTEETSEDVNSNEFSQENAVATDENSSQKEDEEKVEETEPKAKKQTRAENAEFAQKRREEAVIKKREAEIYKKAQIDLLIGTTNKFTGEKIADEDDVNEYLLMKEAETAGFDPTTEMLKFQKQKAREARKQTQTQDFDVETDKQIFREKYPDVDINTLVKDSEFSSFAEPFVKKVPLSVIYDQYNLMKKRIDEQATTIAEEKYKRKYSSPGSFTDTRQTKPQGINDLSDAEFEDMVMKAKRGELRKT